MTLRGCRAQHGAAIRERIDFFRKAVQSRPCSLPPLLRDAEYAMQGRFILPGTLGERYFAGNPPRWHEVLRGDLEYICSLNRMQHWETLIKAYAATGEIRYAQKVCAELADCFDEPLFASLLQSVKHHGRALLELPPLSWPNADHNHYLHENLGLLYAACMYDFLPESEAWCGHALRELERCAQNQFGEDGGQVEGCPGYHNTSLRFLCSTLELIQAHELPPLPTLTQRVENGMAYSIHCMRANGESVPWGDSSPPPKAAIHAAGLYYGITGDGKYLDTLRALVGETAFTAECDALLWDAPALLTYAAGEKRPAARVFREGAERKQYKSAAFHSCLMLDGREPYEYLNRWRFGSMAAAGVGGVHDDGTLLWTQGFHENYAPVTHRRVLALLGEEALLVLDTLDGRTTETAEIFFHHNTTQLNMDGACARADFDGVSLSGKQYCGEWADETLKLEDQP